jgi:hypothetical protein
LQDDVHQFGCVKWYDVGSNPCPTAPVLGACCHPVTMTCAMTSSSGCPSPWVWMGAGTLCEPNNCPHPMGACCFVQGECEFLTEAACLAAVGHVEWLGYGSSCSPPSPCEQPGACCNLSTGACTFAHPSNCEQWPLYFVGPGTECLPDDQCPEMGACCEPNSECTYLNLFDCLQQGGWLMPGVPCVPDPCSPPPTPTEKTTWGKIKASFR